MILTLTWRHLHQLWWVVLNLGATIPNCLPPTKVPSMILNNRQVWAIALQLVGKNYLWTVDSRRWPVDSNCRIFLRTFHHWLVKIPCWSHVPNKDPRCCSIAGPIIQPMTDCSIVRCKSPWTKYFPIISRGRATHRPTVVSIVQVFGKNPNLWVPSPVLIWPCIHPPRSWQKISQPMKMGREIWVAIHRLIIDFKEMVRVHNFLGIVFSVSHPQWAVVMRGLGRGTRCIVVRPSNQWMLPLAHINRQRIVSIPQIP